MFPEIKMSSDALQSLMFSPEKNSLSLRLKKANEEKISSCQETEQKDNLVLIHSHSSNTTKKNMWIFFISVYSSNVLKD